MLTKSSITGSFDNLTGTSGNDTFNASADGLLETGDVIVGGAGTDTLNSRYTITAGTTIAPSVSGVEVHNVRLDHDGDAADVVAYDMGDITGATKVVLDRAKNSGSTADAVFTISGVGFTTDVAVGITGGDTGADNSSVDLTATYQSVTGSADSATLELNGAAANVVTIADIETLNITTAKTETSASATGKSVLNSLVAEDAKTVKITGEGALTLSATDFASTVTVDASAQTGGVNYTVSSADDTLTFTGGSGNDRVNIGAMSELSTVDELDGGTGTDTFATSDTAISSAEQKLLADELTGFEKLEFTANTSVTVDMTDLAVFDTVVFSGATTATAGTGASGGESGGNIGSDAHTIAGVDTGDAIIVTNTLVGGEGESIADRTAEVDAGDGGDALVLTPELDNGSNSVTITLSAEISGGDGGDFTGATDVTAGSAGDGGDAINAASFETVTIVTAQNSAGNLTSLAIAGGAAGVPDGAHAGNAGSSVVVNTNGKIIVQGAIDLNLGTIAGTNATVDANAFTGDLTVTGEAGSNTFIGGSGDDVFTGALGLDTYTLGAGENRVVVGLGSGATESDAAAASSGTTPNTSFESVTDFDKVLDKLEFLTDADGALTLAIATNATASTGTAAIDAEGIASFAAADDTLAERITAVEAGINAGGTATAGQFAVFEHGGSTYVLVSDGTDNLAVGDVIVKLTGVAGITSTELDANGYLTLG